MKKCKECGKRDWEIVVGYLRREEDRAIHIYQCKGCKRIVADNQDLEMDGGERR